jgi:excinuclease ABC subunit A
VFEVDGHIYELSEDIPSLGRYKSHNIEVVVDRLVIEPNLDKTRVADSIEASMKLAGGSIMVNIADTDEDVIYSEQFACVYCNISLGETEPRNFSFNNPHGACSTCTGLGFKMVVDPDLVIPDKTKTIEEGAIEGWSKGGSLSSWHMSQLNSFSEIDSFRIDIPVQELEPQTMDMILNGTKTKIKMSYRSSRGRTFRWNRRFEGVIGNLERRYTETESENVRKDIERYMTSLPCQGCSGQRLKPESLAVTIGNETIMSVSDKSISEAADWIALLENPRTLSMRDKSIASQILKELSGRLQFLLNVGLDYLTLSRTASTLSGGEAQRIRLATQIGSGLMGVLYVCDEPSIGLHPADDYRLINTLKGLRDVGNTVLIVEHDEAIMRAADHIVDLGPGAGEHGGEIVASGSVSKIMASKNSLTGQYFSTR